MLFRSGKTPEYPTRIDVLFKDVRAMELRAWFSRLEITEVDPEFLLDTPSKGHELMEVGNRVYRIDGGCWSGFIVGGAVFVHEDEGELFQPSKFDLTLD